MSEQVIEVGQRWASKDGKRVVEVLAYNERWDDCQVRNVENRGWFDIYGRALRNRYTLTDPRRQQPAPSEATEKESGDE